MVNHLVMCPQHKSQLGIFFLEVSYFVFLNNLQIGGSNWKLGKSRSR